MSKDLLITNDVVVGSDLRKVNGFIDIFVDELGNVYRNDDDYLVLAKVFENKTSVGTYLVVNITTEEGAIKPFFLAHRLIAMAFHKCPDDAFDKFDVNHIDGDKHNNKADNIEWCTRSENCFHALKAGLRKDNISITITDLLLNKETYYYSTIEAARCLGIPRNDLYTLISRHKTLPYKGRYVFTFNKSAMGAVKRKTTGPIICKDYVLGVYIVADSANEMAMETGINSSSIRKRINSNYHERMLGGYDFFYLLDVKNGAMFPVFTKESAVISRNRMFSKVGRNPKTPLLD